jgi:hypothetical protein
MEFTGRIINITPIEKIGDKQTPKFTMVIEQLTDNKYPSSISVDVRGEKTQRHKEYQEDNVVTVSLNSKAREYKGRRYNSLSAWKIEKENHIDNAEESDLPF